MKRFDFVSQWNKIESECVKFEVRSSKFQVPSSKFQVPSSKFQVPSSKFQVQGSNGTGKKLSRLFIFWENKKNKNTVEIFKK